MCFVVINRYPLSNPSSAPPWRGQQLTITHLTEETAIKHQIRDYLDLKGVFHFPILQGLGAAKGIPDRIAVKGGRFFAIEVKAKNGRMSPFQRDFRDRLQEAGGVYIEARSLEDVMRHL